GVVPPLWPSEQAARRLRLDRSEGHVHEGRGLEGARYLAHPLLIGDLHDEPVRGRGERSPRTTARTVFRVLRMVRGMTRNAATAYTVAPSDTSITSVAR